MDWLGSYHTTIHYFTKKTVFKKPEKNEVKFYREFHVISTEGVYIDPQKIKAVVK